MSPYARLLAVACLLTQLGALAACGHASTDDEASVDARSVEIIDGTPATAYPEAAIVNLYKGGALLALCSGAIVAPNVVLTAGHCIDGYDAWRVVAPYAGAQQATGASAATSYVSTGTQVNAQSIDVGLVFLDSPIVLKSYPSLATTPLPERADALNLGRVRNGSVSYSSVFVSSPVALVSAASLGFPNDYTSADKIQPGDSGGPVIAKGTHTIVAVNSGAAPTFQVLARVDVVASWIAQQIDAHRGAAASTKPPGGAGPSVNPAREQMRQACVDQINAMRASVGVPPLVRFTAREACADTQATQDAQTGAHTAAGICGELAQNECPAWPSLASISSDQAAPGGQSCLTKLWNEKTGSASAQAHYAAMVSTKYTKVACGFATTPDGKAWSVQDYL